MWPDASTTRWTTAPQCYVRCNVPNAGQCPGMSMMIFVLAIDLDWSVRPSQHKVIVISLVHMKIHFVLIGVPRACFFRSLFDLFNILCLSKAYCLQEWDISWVLGYNLPISPVSIVSPLDTALKEWHGITFTAIHPVSLRILGATTTCFQRIATVQALLHSLGLFAQVAIENETLTKA